MFYPNTQIPATLSPWEQRGLDLPVGPDVGVTIGCKRDTFLLYPEAIQTSSCQRPLPKVRRLEELLRSQLPPGGFLELDQARSRGDAAIGFRWETWKKRGALCSRASGDGVGQRRHIPLWIPQLCGGESMLC